MRFKFSIIALSLLGLMLSSIICKSPASFVVTSIDIYPPVAAIGEEVGVEVKISNTGGSEGIYKAVLMVNGSQVESRTLNIIPGSTIPLIFSITENNTGSYTINMEGKRGKLEVRTSRFEMIELWHDNDKPGGSYTLSGTNGLSYAVNFVPPPKEMTITDLRFYGKLNNAGSQNFILKISIRDENFNEIYSRNYPETIFMTDPSWIDIPLHGVKVDSDFYIVITPESYPNNDLALFYDTSITNQYSEIAQQDKLIEWNIKQTPKESTNWMIRVIGFIMIP
jgi:hypothetical protein